jgi:type III restriction enzyme
VCGSRGRIISMNVTLFTGHVLNIHTNRTGRIEETKSNQALIDQLRDAARKVDSDDNPYRAIVSVLMLREGWDVRNVVVIVPLALIPPGPRFCRSRPLAGACGA